MFQSTLGYIALLIATFHALLFGWKRAFEEESYRFYMPPTFVVAVALPVTVIMGKAVLMMPCVAWRLKRIRRGCDGNKHHSDRIRPAAHVSPERITIMQLYLYYYNCSTIAQPHSYCAVPRRLMCPCYDQQKQLFIETQREKDPDVMFQNLFVFS